MALIKKFLMVMMVVWVTGAQSKNYYIHPILGNDGNDGTSMAKPFKTLASIERLQLRSGDHIILANGQTYLGSLNLVGQNGNKKGAIKVNSSDWGNGHDRPAVIDFKGKANGILIQDCSFIEISAIQITGDGFGTSKETPVMRCGVLVTSVNAGIEQVSLDRISINKVFYENAGFKRDSGEVRTANGTQKYGWGIRVINKDTAHLIKQVKILNCSISNVEHTGIKISGLNKNISEVNITGNQTSNTGGPGIQLAGVQSAYIANNRIDHSGSNDDTRKWGRGSGLWTWGCSHIMIEKNQFLWAHGPGDSAGAHIDFNCDNVIIQYNLSANNAGGFCEILGNTHNCSYRYNVSINDGYRIKGKDGAFQEGKTLWLSGFTGDNSPRKGPVNTYIYNNTIYCDSAITPKIAIDNTSGGILIANNIFYVKKNFRLVTGDQNKPDVSTVTAKGLLFENNLFLADSSWPKDINFKDTHPLTGDPGFLNAASQTVFGFTPKNIDLIKNKGMTIDQLPSDVDGLFSALQLKTDILGKPIKGKPSLGAIEPNH